MFKFLIVVLISLVKVSSAQEFVSAIPDERIAKFNDLPGLDPATICAGTTGIKSYCDSQCTDTATTSDSIVICNSPLEEAAADARKCPSTKPHCIGELGEQYCSADIDPTCPIPRPAICDTPGNYPDPSNCNVFYECTTSGVNIVASKKTCPAGTAFNPTGPRDRLCEVGGKCVTANCTGVTGVEWRPMNYIGFLTDRMALKCTANVGKVFICDAGLALDLNITSSVVCKVKCLQNYQRAPIKGKPDSYYLCLLGKPYVRECETGSSFDPVKLECT